MCTVGIQGPVETSGASLGVFVCCASTYCIGTCVEDPDTVCILLVLALHSGMRVGTFSASVYHIDAELGRYGASVGTLLFPAKIRS